MRYSEKKAAQVAAYFIFREGGTIEILKLMKLMYLAERESLLKYGEPITGDNFYSMNHGPILSITLDHMNNFIESEEDGWESWISDRENHMLELRVSEDPTPKLLQLCDADVEVLDSVYKEFGGYTGGELRNITHKICTEWEDPDYSSIPIPYSRVLKCVGHDPDIAMEIDHKISEQRRLDDMFEFTSEHSDLGRRIA